MLRDLSSLRAACLRCGEKGLLDWMGHCPTCRAIALPYILPVCVQPRTRIRYTWLELGAGALFAFAGALGTIVGIYTVLAR